MRKRHKRETRRGKSQGYKSQIEYYRSLRRSIGLPSTSHSSEAYSLFHEIKTRFHSFFDDNFKQKIRKNGDELIAIAKESISRKSKRKVRHAVAILRRIETVLGRAGDRTAKRRATLARQERSALYKPYQQRNDLLRELGYADYESYLRSPAWQSIRRHVLEHGKNTCVVCGQRASQVHHVNYQRETLQGVDLKGMISLCRFCHESAEIDSVGNKRTLDETNDYLRRRWKLFHKGTP